MNNLSIVYDHVGNNLYSQYMAMPAMTPTPVEKNNTSMSLIIKYTATEDIYPLLDPSYQALFSDHTFSNGSGTLTLIDGVYTIPARTFEDITQLTGIVLPEGVVSFGQKAFSNSGVNKITLPKGFRSVALNSLTTATGIISEIYCYAEEVVELFEQNVTINAMYVPANLLNSYKSSAWAEYVLQWKTFPGGKGFNFDGMIDTDYMWQLGHPIKL